MKKVLYTISSIIIIISLGFFGLIKTSHTEHKTAAQDQLFNRISTTITSANFENAGSRELFIYDESAMLDNVTSIVSTSASLRLSKTGLRELVNLNSNALNLKIPKGKSGFFELELVKADVISPEFVMKERNGSSKTIVNVKQGVHYRGIIKNDNSSVVSVSLFDNMVMGIISNDEGNFVIGPVETDKPDSENYIIYNDRDLMIANNFECGVEGREEKFTKYKTVTGQNTQLDNSAMSSAPVKVYFECDYRMYLDNGSNTQNVSNFVTGMFNNVATIYANEGLAVQISEIATWTGQDPYRNMTQSEQVLTTFGQNTQDNFMGNLAHLLSTRNAGMGGIAWINILCEPYNSNGHSGRYAFSNIESNYSNFPTYSWTVGVVAHEMGHNYGSYHTHACHWPTRPGITNGAIDSCYTAEGGNCFNNPRASRGTIMSYCHLWSTAQGGGIDFNRGFGPLPGDTIRGWYNRAGCLLTVLNSSEAPSTFALTQNSPNPFNPTTNFKFILPVNSVVTLKVYDISGREIVSLINNQTYSAGTYDYQFNSAGLNLSSGVYFYRVYAQKADDNSVVFSDIKKMVLVK